MRTMQPNADAWPTFYKQISSHLGHLFWTRSMLNFNHFVAVTFAFALIRHSLQVRPILTSAAVAIPGVSWRSNFSNITLSPEILTSSCVSK